MELYHVLNRGVDKRTIFGDGKDYIRFVHDMWEFNDVKDVDNVRHRVPSPNEPDIFTDFVNPYIEKERIVDLHGWCLMKNHYHLLLSERVEGGLTKFIRRLNVGYANYFNERNKRSGTLFQGRTKKIHIQTDAHFLHILHYIHLNPLDTLPQARQWRTNRITDAATCMAHLEKYRWSSFLDYIGRKNFPSILTTEFFSDVDIFGDYKKTIRRYLKDIDASAYSSYDLE